MPEADDQWFKERILAVAERRDRLAFADLFHFLMPRFKAFALAKGVAPAQADDMAQDTMLIIWHKAATFRPGEASPKAWLFTIARNRRIDLFRRDGHPHVGLDQVPERTDDAATRPEETLQAGQTRTVLNRALDRLSGEQRTVIEKAFVEDKTHTTVAAELNLPLGTVKSRIRLALQRMRGELSEDLA